MMNFRHVILSASALLLVSCQQGGAGDPETAQASSAIGDDETVRFGGNEPFWGGEVSGASLTYTTPEDPEGTIIAVSRRAGLGGVSWSGEMAGEAFMLAVSEAVCNDTMSDRSYPFTATLQLGPTEVRQGCAWTESMPFTGPEMP